MANYYSTETKGRGDTPARVVGNAALNQRDRVFRAVIPLDAPPLTSTTAGTIINSGDTVSLFRVPAGSRFIGAKLTANVSLGSSTIAVGIAGSTGKYRAAATFTAVDTPTSFGTTAAMAAGELGADEEIILTVAAANMPNAAGNKLIVDMTFSAP